jgi:hypothetical protein
MSPIEFSVEIRPFPLYLPIGPLKQIPIGLFGRRGSVLKYLERHAIESFFRVDKQTEDILIPTGLEEC